MYELSNEWKFRNSMMEKIQSALMTLSPQNTVKVI